jgi:hypothetical protein
MKIHINWNALGLSAAVICAIHCALFPLLVSSLPLLGINWLHNIYFEAAMIATAFIIGGMNMLHGYRRHHHRLLPLISFTTGMGLFTVYQFYHEFNFWLIISATVLIVLAYYFNWKFCRIARHCHASDCNH